MPAAVLQTALGEEVVILEDETDGAAAEFGQLFCGEGEGVDVVIRVVETHGRRETELLLDGSVEPPSHSRHYRAVASSEAAPEIAMNGPWLARRLKR